VYLDSFFLTDGRRFAEFVLDEKKMRVRKAPNKTTTDTSKKEKKNRRWCSVQQLSAPKTHSKSGGNKPNNN